MKNHRRGHYDHDPTTAYEFMTLQSGIFEDFFLDVSIMDVYKDPMSNILYRVQIYFQCGAYVWQASSIRIHRGGNSKSL